MRRNPARRRSPLPKFPSLEWFDTAADVLNKSDSSHRLGTCDTDMGVQVGDEYFLVPFDAFEVRPSRRIDAAIAGELDFTLVQSPEQWKAMIEDIQLNGHATHDFTLNSLDLHTETELAIGKDYVKRDAFYRFNQTLQEYFDTAAKFETTY